MAIETAQAKKPRSKTFLRSIGAFVADSALFTMTYIGGGNGLSKLWGWRLSSDKSRRTLAALDEDQLYNLSDIGRQIRCEERRAGR